MPQLAKDLSPLAKHFIWLLRDDLRQKLQINRVQDPKFQHWWLLKGRSEYPYWDQLSSAEIQLLSERTSSIKLGDIEIPMPKAYVEVMRYRADVVKQFNVDGKLDQLGLAAWFFVYGIEEHRLQAIIDDAMIAALDQPVMAASDVASSDVPAPTVLMALVWHLLDTELKKSMPLTQAKARAKFLGWFFSAVGQQVHIAALIANRWRHWLIQPVAAAKPAVQALPRFATLAIEAQPKLQARFDLKSEDGYKKAERWANQSLMVGSAWSWLNVSDEAIEASAIEIQSPAKPFGVNLFGFAFGELGIGEHLRMAVEACEFAGIPYRVVNIDAGTDLRQADAQLKDQVEKSLAEASYAINIFCLPAFDTIARIFLKMGDEVFRGHYNIGWWAWELPVWPQQWKEAFRLVDEVWSYSNFVRQMYALATDKPVQLMPIPVNVKRGISVPRQRFGLPARGYLFLFVFDFNSHLARKNPGAVIAAFKKAFPGSVKDTHLVLKVMNGKPEDPRWQAFVAECEADPRIHLISETLQREELLGLIALCDAYVSLHRAEGFGMTLAEAMLYGKPVIATNYSGNSDFMDPELTFPVEYKLREIQAGEYPFVRPEDQAVWAEPSIEDAAAQMKAAKAADTASLQKSIKGYAQKQFSVARIGQLMRNRLYAIRNAMTRA